MQFYVWLICVCLIYFYTYVCWRGVVCAGDNRCPWRPEASTPLELELQTLGYLTWLLGIKLRFFAGAISTLNHWTVLSAQCLMNFCSWLDWLEVVLSESNFCVNFKISLTGGNGNKNRIIHHSYKTNLNICFYFLFLGFVLW